VTSRVPLGLAGETTWRVPSLSLPGTPAVGEAVGGTARQEPPTHAQVAASEAAQLFSERAAAALPGFALTEANATAVRAICARLDGIPLAIELAAPWVRVLPVAELATRLAADLGLLAAGSRAALPRQQTLQATLAWSYALLNSAEQRLLQRLAIFAGSFTLAAAEAVGAADDLAPSAIVPLLARLVDASLVNAEPAAGRYRLLETVRVDALERLTAQGEREAARRRHATYYRDRALAALPALWDSHPERDRWFAELDRDLDNIRAAWRWADEVGDIETSLWFGGALQAYFNVRGFVGEARRRLGQTLAQAEAAPTRARAWAQLAAATLARAEEDYAEAIHQAGASVALFRQVDDQPGLTHALIILGAAHAWGEEVAPARPLLEEALALSRAAEQGPGVGLPLFQLGLLALIEGDLLRAEQVLREGLAALRARCDMYRVSHLLFTLGFAELGLGRVEQARARFQESLVIATERRDQWALAFILEGFGSLAATQGQAELALRLAGSAAALREHEDMHVSIRAFRRLRDLLLAPAWAALDADAAAAWAAGRALPLDDVLALLPGTQEPAGLTDRAHTARAPECALDESIGSCG
jgi:predicted ATPase